MSMQLNGKEFKQARDILSKWHVADFKLADELLQKQARIKALKAILETDMELLERINAGEQVIKSKDELETEAKQMFSKIKAEENAYAKIKEEADKALNEGRELVTDELVKAMTEYSKNIHSDECDVALTKALVKWFTELGVKNVQEKDVEPYKRALGQKKASAKMKCKNGNHNGVNVKKTMVDIFLGALCDEESMKKALPTHKWITIIEKKTK